jgi:death-on-curing protein
VTHYLDLAEYLWLAEQVTGIEAAVLAKASRVELADSALRAPSAGFGDVDMRREPGEETAGLVTGDGADRRHQPDDSVGLRAVHSFIRPSPRVSC